MIMCMDMVFSESVKKCMIQVCEYECTDNFLLSISWIDIMSVNQIVIKINC